MNSVALYRNSGGLHPAMLDLAVMPLSIRLFGPFEARVNGAPLPRLRSRKGQWLLALLVLRASREVERGWLAGTLWPESVEPHGLVSLRTSLADLRSALGTEAGRLRSPTPHTLALDLEGAEVDLIAFDAAVARGDRAALARAADLYRGPLLEGCDEGWAFPERQVREQAFLAALEQLAAGALKSGESSAAEGYLRRALAADPLRESAQRALMQVLAAAGSYTAACQVYRELCQLLHHHFHAQPGPETRGLFEQLRAEARLQARPPPAAAARLSGGGEAGADASLMPPDPARRFDGVAQPAAPPLPAALRAPAERRPEGGAPAGPVLPAPITGAVPLGSPYYVVRRTDAQLREAILRRDSIVLIKGARQTGKSSLLARGLQQARELGFRVVLTDLQALTGAEIQSTGTLFQALGERMAGQLNRELLPADLWDRRRGPNSNFERYLQRVLLGESEQPLVWGLDEVDVLFSTELSTEVFGLLRSWHNARALQPDGPWARLTLAMAYATEAHLFIANLNQSPFNIGTRLALADFSVAETADLNRRYGSPLGDEVALARCHALLGGHPYLVHHGLQEMTRQGIGLAALEAQAARDTGLFGDHLRHLLIGVTRDPALCAALRCVLKCQPCPTEESFYRLRSAGVLAGESSREARLRCELYARYLAEHLG